MKKYLITANAGTGKSTINDVLEKMGYESYDLEKIPDMFGMYRKDTREVYTDFDNGNKEMIANAEWLLNKEMLQKLFEQQKNDIAFYCGTSSNIMDMLSLFDKVFLLVVSKEILHKRLSNREGQNDMGGNEESRQAVLGWKDWWENEMRKHNNIIEIDAEGTPGKIVDKIIAIIG